MKNFKVISFFVALLFIVACSGDWLQNVESNAREIDENAVLEKEMDSVNKNFTTRIQKFKIDTKIKIQANFSFNDTLQINTVYYKNEGLIILESKKACEPLIYKRKRKQNEPFAKLVERITYFKSKNYGVQKTKELDFFVGNNIDSLKKELSKKEFVVKEIGEKEYSEISNKYNSILRNIEFSR